MEGEHSAKVTQKKAETNAIPIQEKDKLQWPHTYKRGGFGYIDKIKKVQ